MAAVNVFNQALSFLKAQGFSEEHINWMDNIPPIVNMSDSYFLSELAWCIL